MRGALKSTFRFTQLNTSFCSFATFRFADCKFANAHFDMERIGKRYRTIQPKEGEAPLKWHLDLKLSNRMDMETMGVLPENTIDEGICTYDATTDYFSARRLGIDSGRIYNGIMLK